MSEFSRILNRPVTLPLDGGLTLSFERLNDTIRVEAEEWVEARVRAHFEKALEVADAADRPRFRAELAADFKSGAYDFGKPKCEEVLGTLAGQLWLLRRLLLKHHPDVTADEVAGLLQEYGAEIGEALKAAAEAEKNRRGARTPPPIIRKVL